MTTPVPPLGPIATIVTPMSTWELRADPEGIREYARRWRQLEAAARAAKDYLREPFRAADEDWEGRAHNQWLNYHSQLFYKLVQIADHGQLTARRLDEVALQIEEAQEEMSSALLYLRDDGSINLPRKASPVQVNLVPSEIIGDSIVFHPRSDREISYVVDARKRAEKIRSDLEDALDRTHMAHPESDTTLQAIIADDLDDERTKWEAGRPSWDDLPPEVERNIGILRYTEEHGKKHVVLNTGAGDDRVHVLGINDDKGRPDKILVTVNGETKTFDADERLTLRTGAGYDEVTYEKDGGFVPPVNVVAGRDADLIRLPEGASGWVDELPIVSPPREDP